MNRKIIFIGTLLLFSLMVFGQVSGNRVIGRDYNDNQANKSQAVDKLYLSDSSFVIHGNVLINIIADNYVATLGVSEASTTLKDANTKIDERIQKFISALNTKMSIPLPDIYVDMSTQTQISDYKVNGNYAEQYITGFEQKKNVIVKFKNIKDLDKMIAIAADNKIYDIAKVDYIVTDINKIYSQLFQAATETINNKKELYIKATNIKLASSSQIYGESFYSFYPSQLYKSYTPNITTEYSDDRSYARRKDLKENTTYYYDKINYSGFDKVINPIVTEPTVEFVLMLQIKFDIEKN
jgi:uncharacterized protein YggE